MLITDNPNTTVSKEQLTAASGKFSYKELLWAVVAVWVIGMFSALICFDTFKVGSAPVNIEYAKSCCIGYGFVAIIALLSTRLILGRLWSRPACIIISCLTALMLVGVSVNMAGYLSQPGSTWAYPGLDMWTDAGSRYLSAMYLWEGWPLSDRPSFGYQLFLLFCFNIFGRGVLVPILFNVLCTSVSAALMGCICHRLCPGGDVRRRAWVAVLLFAIIPSVTFFSTILQREAIIICGVSLFTLILTDIYRGRLQAGSLAAAAVGAFMLFPTRHMIGYLLLALILICFIYSYCRHTGSLSGRYNSTLAALLFCFAIIAGGNAVNSNGDTTLLNTDKAAQNTQSMMGHETVRKYAESTDNYYAQSPIHRLIYLPMAAVAQYFPPFPWNYTRDKVLGAFVPFARLSILWYITGGLILAYYALCIYRRRAAGGLRVWAALWPFCYLGVAYMSAGTVARYALPFLPLAIPLALQTIISVRHGAVSIKNVKIYVVAYAIAVAAVLIFAYNRLKM